MTARFSIINLGCKVNRVEADSMAARLLSCGATQSPLETAHVVIINTCTVTGEADSKSRKAVRRALREAERASVIVCGCGAAADPEQFTLTQEDTRGTEPQRDLEVIPNKEEALQKAGELLGLSFINAPETVSRVGNEFNTRVAVKVQDGCNNACSYCIVPKARGKAQSTSLAQALAEIATQLKAGAREVVLTGIDLGSYGDETGTTLTHLLSEALALQDGYRLRLSSIELLSISDELVELMAASEGRVCAHLHVPLQSGSDAVLKAMNRKYDTTQFLGKISSLKSVLPHMACTTDVIVGFPGETEEDYKQTLQLCSEIGFSRIHVFRYSKRPGTAAAAMPGHLSMEVKADRAERLRRLSEQLTKQDALRRIGSSESILIENELRGRSESYYPVKVASDIPLGKLATMRIVDFSRGQLVAEK